MQLFSLSLSEMGEEWMKGEREGRGKGEGEGEKEKHVYQRRERGRGRHYALQS